MKSVLLFAAAVAALVPARAAETAGYKSESKAQSEIFTSTITKVYSAQDGDYRHVAYVVAWRDQEVIVTPFSSRNENLSVGDTVRCEMRQIHAPNIAGMKGRMVFSLLGRPGDSALDGVVPPPDDPARLEAIAAEVARRRAERDTRAGRTESPAPKNTSGPTSAPATPSPTESRQP